MKLKKLMNNYEQGSKQIKIYNLLTLIYYNK